MQIGCTRVNWSNWLRRPVDARPRSDALWLVQAPTSAACSHSRASRHAFPRHPCVCGSLAVARTESSRVLDVGYVGYCYVPSDQVKFRARGLREGGELLELLEKERAANYIERDTRLNVKLHEYAGNFSFSEILWRFIFDTMENETNSFVCYVLSLFRRRRNG